MGLFVAAGKSVTSSRGMITGGDRDSEVTWKCFCRDTNDPKLQKVAEAQIERLLSLDVLIEADEMPITQDQIRDGEARDRISQEVPLTKRGEGGVKGRQARTMERVRKAREDSVNMRHEDLKEGEKGPEKHTVAMSGETEEPKGSSKKGGAKRADPEADSSTDSKADSPVVEGD